VCGELFTHPALRTTATHSPYTLCFRVAVCSTAVLREAAGWTAALVQLYEEPEKPGNAIE
jgi:hypothetical protein